MAGVDKPTEQQLQSFACWIAGKEGKQCDMCEGSGRWCYTVVGVGKKDMMCVHCDGTGVLYPDYTHNATAMLDDVIPKALNTETLERFKAIFTALLDSIDSESLCNSHAFCQSCLKALAQTPLWEQYIKEQGGTG